MYMVTLFPLVLHNGYLDVTVTKYRLFTVAVIIYAVIMALLFMLDLGDNMTYKGKLKVEKKRQEFLPSDIFMALFLVANLMAFIMADSKTLALTGSDGRRLGFAFMICAALMYFFVSFGQSQSLGKLVLPTFALITSLMCLMAVLQFVGLDPFGLLAAITSSQRAKFISTVGNINVFSSFVSLTLPLFGGMLMYAKEKKNRIIYGIATFLAGAGILAANSDMTYSGLGVVLVVMLYVAINTNKTWEYFRTVLVAFLGLCFTLGLATLTGTGISKIDGIGEIFTDVRVVAAVVAILVVKLLWESRRCKAGDDAPAKNAASKLQNILLTLALIIVAMVTIIYLKNTNNAILIWSDKWGDYRGYIWSRLATLYGGFPLLNKIFGNGNESIGALMDASAYATEMYDVTGVGYDSAHNVYLHYLVTTGIFGAVTYIGLIATSIANCIRAFKSGEGTLALPLALSILAFSVQDIFNIGQPVTTPLIFLLFGVVAGVRRSLRA